jgi:putative phage-type endonuclease
MVDRMSLTILPDIQQGSDAWFDQRRGMITASAVGKLLTPTLKVADNDTARGLTTTLVAERISGFTEDTPMTSDMYRGVDSEPFARDYYSGHYGEATEVGFMVREGDGWQLGYSPDGLVGDDGLIEIKAPRAKTHLNTILADRVPGHYMAQCQAGLLVSGRDWLDFVSFCGGLPLWVKRVEPDPAWFAAIEAACVAFEANAAQIVADYRTKVADLPTTERIDFNLVELKLA